MSRDKSTVLRACLSRSKQRFNTVNDHLSDSPSLIKAFVRSLSEILSFLHVCGIRCFVYLHCELWVT